ncbi:MAG: hypothetical protein HY832_00855 [Candidatus Aenigmarchaeota archaeon]|nr:hypothetical protein [Candidatus Aenigmarchaeota archaeon]
MSSAQSQEIVRELKHIRKDLEYIKEHMVDADTILTAGEEERLDESLRAYHEGNVKKLSEFEREMNQ